MITLDKLYLVAGPVKAKQVSRWSGRVVGQSVDVSLNGAGGDFMGSRCIFVVNLSVACVCVRACMCLRVCVVFKIYSSLEIMP